MRKPLLKLDPTYLIDNPRGLKRLYQHMVIDSNKNLQMKGKGNEVSDLNKVMKVLRGWHFEAMPKFEINYFADRLLKVGNDKATKAFMSKLRNVYKGLEVLDDFQPTAEGILPPAVQPNNSGFEYINTSTGANPFDDYANFASSKPVN